MKTKPLSPLKVALVLSVVSMLLAAGHILPAEEPHEFATIEKQFRELPMESRRLIGPLFWLHGDESAERLTAYLNKVAEGGNGCFTAESRPHWDWLGENWYRDLDVCLQAARRLDLRMWIFDEQWWPSGEVGGKLPPQYGSKYLDAVALQVEGPRQVHHSDFPEKRVAVLAGRELNDGIDGDSLVDLTDRVAAGSLTWSVPPGRWKIMAFFWRYSTDRPGRPVVDGASREAVEWYIRSVYQPHYDRFANDFGSTICGYFYDEPATLGDWGTEVIPLLKQRGVDWKKALVAWKFQLAGEEQIAARYQYRDALTEAWGQTLYGGLSQWCHEHKVLSIGHFSDHDHHYLRPESCAGNLMQLQKYSDMGAIDAIWQQFSPGKRDMGSWQIPKLGSSVSHVYGKPNDIAMVEIFGARGQDLPYPEMKYWTDHMFVSGINFHIPHSFNPRAPYDRDCPPFFYNGGFEPRWPLYRVYADYSARLSLMLSGGHHVCPVALLYLGQSYHVGKSILPDELTAALQDALFDCDWLPYDVFEDDNCIAGQQLRLRQENYRVLIVPAVEAIPYATLAKVKQFFDGGGIVIGYGMLPHQSATLGKSGKDIESLRRGIWTNAPSAGLHVCQVNAAGGRSYYLPEAPTAEQLRQVLIDDAGIQPTLDVLEGDTGEALHVLHRVKHDRDLFLICNQNDQGDARKFKFCVRAQGVPECWDPMRNKINSIPFHRIDDQTVHISMCLEPLESVLLVFQPKRIPRTPRLSTPPESNDLAIPVTRQVLPVSAKKGNESAGIGMSLKGSHWMWHPAPGGGLAAPVGSCYFRRVLEIPAERTPVEARIRLTADNSFVLFVNGHTVLQGNNYAQSYVTDLTGWLRSGKNVLAIIATNGGEQPNPAGLIGCYSFALDDRTAISGIIDSSWRTCDQECEGWTRSDFDDALWSQAEPVVAFGDQPWGTIDGSQWLTQSTVEADPFVGFFTLSADLAAPGTRVCLECAHISPECAASIRVNGSYTGGFIGRPFQLDITAHVQVGRNRVEIEPFAPTDVRITFHSENPK